MWGDKGKSSSRYLAEESFFLEKKKRNPTKMDVGGGEGLKPEVLYFVGSCAGSFFLLNGSPDSTQ